VSFTGEMKDSADRFAGAKNKLVESFRKHEIDSVGALKRAYKTNPEFKSEWTEIWKEIARKDGGKLSLTTVLTILGAVLGSAGIAALGGAFAVPLALVLGIGGLLVGTEVDERRKEKKLEKEF